MIQGGTRVYQNTKSSSGPVPVRCGRYQSSAGQPVELIRNAFEMIGRSLVSSIRSKHQISSSTKYQIPNRFKLELDFDIYLYFVICHLEFAVVEVAMIDLLKKVHLFETLRRMKLEKIQNICVREKYAKDTPMFLRGRPGNRCYVITKGAVRISSLSRYRRGSPAGAEGRDYFGRWR